MKNSEDLRIIGIDDTRPPIINKKPYIDLVFTLSEQASKQWCQNFNGLFSNSESKAKINLKDSTYIETWVKTMDKIPEHLEMLKTKVTECNELYNVHQIAMAQAATNKNKTLQEEQGPQGQLNNIIAQLDFN